MKEVVIVYQDRLFLTVEDILNEDFKLDTRGYRPQEVDRFLDKVIHDYEEFKVYIKELESEKRDLIDDNVRLKQEIRNLRTKIDVLKDSSSETSGGTTNADLLRRLSNLEKYIYGKE